MATEEKARKVPHENVLVKSCFTWQDQPGNKYAKKYTCRYCSHFKDVVQDSITRLTEHVTCVSTSTGRPVKGCIGAVPAGLRRELQDIQRDKFLNKQSGSTKRGRSHEVSATVPPSAGASPTSETVLIEDSPPSLRSSAPSGTSPCPHASDLDVLICKAVISGAIPFRFVENPYFVEFCHVMCPSYQVPTRKVLVARIDELHKWVMNQKAAKVKGKVGTISSDGATIFSDPYLQQCKQLSTSYINKKCKAPLCTTCARSGTTSL